MSDDSIFVNGLSVEDMIWLLKRPFPADKIHWRVGSTNQKAQAKQTGDQRARPTKGVALAYIDARDAMHRLDEVVGPANWQDRYPWSESGKLCCEIGILIDGEWRWKANGAGDTNMEADKGAFSDAFKRAAVMWGIGRYLYALPNEWMELNERGQLKDKPKLPEWAVPNEFNSLQERTKFHTALARAWADKDGQGIMEVVGDMTQEQQLDLWRDFNSTQRREIKELLAEARKSAETQ